MTEKAELISLYKEVGETPLECVMRFKDTHPEYKATKMTYLGRLDPMAEGLLLVLAGNTREREKYLGLDKTYEFEVLWSFESDTHDILGKVEGGGKSPEKLESKMRGLVKKIQGKTVQVYPLFSSKMFGGSFLKARESNIEAAEIPEKRIKIFTLEHVHTRAITGREILKTVTERVLKVQGDFRQSEALGSWQNTLATKENEIFLISRFSADVSSGTYIRGLAHEMGKILKTGALAWSIKRTRVGEHRLTQD